MPVLVEEFEVFPQLAAWRLPRAICLDILDRAAGQRANVTASDPSGTGGLEMRRWCTRFLRDEEDLKALGWVHCSHDQVDGIRNDELRIKLVVLNTDARTGVPSKQPASVAEKGPAAEKLIQRNEERRQGTLFGDFVQPDNDPLSDYDFLYFCVHASEKYVSAEISRPSTLTAGFVTGFSQRVILCQPGEKPGLGRHDPVPEDFAEIEKPTVVRRG